MALWTDPSRQFLIQAIRSRPILWDKNYVVDHNYRNAKNEAFGQVVDELNAMFPMSTKFNHDDVRSQWKNLKDTFVRKLRWLTEGKYREDPTKEPTWKFYRMLSFLEDKDSKRRQMESASSPSIDASTNFDIVSLQNSDQMHMKQDIQMQYDNSSSSEEQMLQMFSQTYTDSKPQSVQTVSPPSPSLPMPQVSSCSTETICAKPSYTNHMHHHDDDEPRRKRAYNRRTLPSHAYQDEFDLFGACIAAQLKRLCDETGRSASLRLQKKLNDVLFENQIELLED